MNISDNIQILVPSEADLNSIVKKTPLGCFTDVTREFLNRLSSSLLKPEFKVFPELVALGFWLRKIKTYSFRQDENGVHKPLGVVLHFTPANVDTMFVYSWVTSLLMGNINIVRIATQSTQQQSILLNELARLFALPDYVALRERNCFIRYDKESDVTRQLSRFADARVLWGGDKSVMQIKAAPAKPRTRDISFADRYSATLVNGDNLNQESIPKVAESLWRDIKPYSQQACSSPRLIVWFGSKNYIKSCLEALDNAAINAEKSITLANEQLVFSQYVQATGGGKAFELKNLCVVEPEIFDIALLNAHTGNQSLLLTSLERLDQLNEIVDAKCQTLSYFGFDKAEIIKLVSELSITGIDRIVPVGQALEFDFNWDGYKLLESFSRYVRVL